jgi:signal transduction histidine kinase/ActR/RegA family two-component response regulator
MAERRQRLLSEVSRDLLDYVGPDPVEPLRRIATKVCGELGDWCAFSLVREDGRLEPVAAWHPDPRQRGLQSELAKLLPPRPWNGEPHDANALVQKRTIVFEHITEQMVRQSSSDSRVVDLYLQIGMTSALVAPMFDGAQPLGQLMLVSTRDGGLRYTHDDTDFAYSLAGRAALAVRNAKLVGEIALERDRQREARLQSDARTAELRAVMNAVPSALALFDAEGRLVLHNRRMSEFFGRDFSLLVGRHYEEVALSVMDDFEPGHGPNLELARRYFADRAYRSMDEMVLIRPRQRTLLRTTAPVLGPAGEYLGRIFAYDDVTDERALDRQRADFLTVAAHELRTPLTPLSMYLQTLERRISLHQEAEPELVNKARRQVSRLGRLVEDLLDISRLESRRLSLTMARISLNELCEQVVSDFRAQARNHEMMLHRAEVAVTVLGDRVRLEQVLVNLLTNALKYSPAGGPIEVRVETESSEAKVSVKDHGIGVPAAEVPMLFQRFFRAANASSRNFGGLGIGLYVSHEIVERHGGRFQVQSKQGQGSTFTFRLPLLRPEQVQARGRVLLLDDDPEILAATGEALREWGYAVDEARDGQTALEMVTAARPDVILVDLRMPVMDGGAFVEKLRGEKVAQGVPLVVLSADREVREEARRLSAEAYLRKPFELEELQSVVDRLAGKKSAQ